MREKPLFEQIPERVAADLKKYKGRRVGFIYWYLKLPYGVLTAVPSKPKIFICNPKGMSNSLARSVLNARSYWAFSKGPIGRLKQHLKHPAPAYTRITELNDDGWISSPNPETIYYTTGLDCGDQYINFNEVPAQLVLDEHLDFADALCDFDSWVRKIDKRNTEPWDQVGIFEKALSSKKSYEISEKRVDRYGEPIGVDREAMVVIESHQKCFVLVQLRKGQAPWNTDDKNLVVTLPRKAFTKYIKSLEGWPARLPVDAVFYLFAIELVTMGVSKWVKEMKIPKWTDQLVRPSF